jgi:hypothetical protein
MYLYSSYFGLIEQPVTGSRQRTDGGTPCGQECTDRIVIAKIPWLPLSNAASFKLCGISPQQGHALRTQPLLYQHVQHVATRNLPLLVVMEPSHEPYARFAIFIVTIHICSQNNVQQLKSGMGRNLQEIDPSSTFI